MKYRVKCTRCKWRGVRTDHVECECYPEWAVWCRPSSPGPGCPSGILWSCPKCGLLPPSVLNAFGRPYRNGSSVIMAGRVEPKAAAA